jgi:hypothetical protein
MELEAILKKLWFSDIKSIKFIEQYYADMLKKPNLKIRLETPKEGPLQTSYYDIDNNEIVIALNNLATLFVQFPNIAYSTFYTLMLHEIGHAIYTSRKLQYTDTMNVLEDNRLEFQISLWNLYAKFNILRYAFQDKNLNQDVSRKSNNPLAITLGLLRTVDNSPWVDYFSKTQRQKEIVAEILKLNISFLSIDKTAYQIDQESNNFTANKLMGISANIEMLVRELIQEKNKPVNPSPPQTKTTEPPQQGGEPVESKSTQQTNSNQEPQAGSNSANQNNGKAEPKPKTKEEKKKQIQEIEKEMKELEDQNIQAKEETVRDGISILSRGEKDISTYDKYEVSAFTTYRSSGIKGSRVVSRYSGNAKQLSMRKFMRKGFVKNEKLFDKDIQELGKGGRSASILFYLDISGSMGEHRTDALYNGKTKIQVATDYLKSFYDTMNRHINIRIFAFGTNTYEITRDELNLNFLTGNLEGSTNPTFVKPKPNEHIVLITDGSFGTDIPVEYVNHANFVLIEPDGGAIREFQNQNIRNMSIVTRSNLIEGLDNATKFLKRILQSR